MLPLVDRHFCKQISPFWLDNRDVQGRNEIRWRLGKETSLAPPCSNLRSFRSKCAVLKNVLHSHTQGARLCTCIAVRRNTQTHERRRGYIRGGSRVYTLNGANTYTLMKHKLIRHTHESRHHDYFNVVLRWLPNTSIYAMCEGVGGCEGSGIISAADHPRTKLFMVEREQCIIVSKIN